MAQATIDLGLNTASFTAGLNEAERKSQSFEGRIAGLFRRSPLQRAERAFGELGANLATGNVAQGLASFVSRITGLGLITGAAVGAAIGVFQKFRGEITETTKAANELDKALAISGYATSAAQVGKSIDAISSSVDTLSKKSKGIGATAFGIISPGFKKGLKDEIDAALAQFSRLEAERPKAEGRQTAIQAEALMGSQREADLAAIRLDKEEKISDIRARQTIEADKALESLGKADPETRMKALTAIQKSAEASIFNVEAAAALQEQKAKDIYDLKEKELGIDKDIAEQALRGVDSEDQKISKLEQELALIQEQLSGSRALTTENRKQLETSEAKTQAELAAARAAASGRPVLSNRDIHERAKLTLADIAANATQGTRLPFNLTDEQLFAEQARALGPAAMARQALRSEEFARQAALRGDLGTAETLFGMSDKLRAGIPGLKSAEQPVSMVDALKEYGKGPEIVTKLEELKSKMDAYWGN